MAIFGKLEFVKQQLKDEKFDAAFKYLEEALEVGSEVNKRLLALPINAFEKELIDEKNFGLEQVYNTKDRESCFFESHRQNIDVQFILEGEEIIEIVNKELLEIDMPYSEEMDLVKYKDARKSSLLKLQKGDVAIFYPDDAHMPCVKLENSVKVIKTVVKVTI